ncbi:unnamed protein product [Closterium sp. NIES-53]
MMTPSARLPPSSPPSALLPPFSPPSARLPPSRPLLPPRAFPHPLLPPRAFARFVLALVRATFPFASDAIAARPSFSSCPQFRSPRQAFLPLPLYLFPPFAVPPARARRPRRAVLPEKKPKKAKGAPAAADVSAMDLDDLGTEPGAAGGDSAGAAALMDSADPRVAALARAQQRKKGKSKWGDTAFGGVEDVARAEEDFQVGGRGGKWERGGGESGEGKGGRERWGRRGKGMGGDGRGGEWRGGEQGPVGVEASQKRFTGQGVLAVLAVGRGSIGGGEGGGSALLPSWLTLTCILPSPLLWPDRHALLCHALLSSAVPCPPLLCCAMPSSPLLCCAMPSSPLLCCAMPSSPLLCHALLSSAVPCPPLLCCAMPSSPLLSSPVLCAVLCCAVLCCAVLCCAVVNGVSEWMAAWGPAWWQGEEEEQEAMEPFNLQQEREEGYFDAEGNYVEYREDTEATDAWLATAEVDPTLAAKAAARAQAAAAAEEAGGSDMGHGEMAAIRRRIADTLRPGETKGAGQGGAGGVKAGKGGKKRGRPGGDTEGEEGGEGRGKGGRQQSRPRWMEEAGEGEAEEGGMDEEARQRLFEQLTEDAMLLMDAGETGTSRQSHSCFPPTLHAACCSPRRALVAPPVVLPMWHGTARWWHGTVVARHGTVVACMLAEVYSDKKETFEREAAGYEAILRARQGLLGGEEGGGGAGEGGKGEGAKGEKGGAGGEEGGSGKKGAAGMDMFGDEDDEGGDGAGEGGSKEGERKEVQGGAEGKVGEEKDGGEGKAGGAGKKEVLVFSCALLNRPIPLLPFHPTCPTCAVPILPPLLPSVPLLSTAMTPPFMLWGHHTSLSMPALSLLVPPPLPNSPPPSSPCDYFTCGFVSHAHLPKFRASSTPHSTPSPPPNTSPLWQLNAPLPASARDWCRTSPCGTAPHMPVFHFLPAILKSLLKIPESDFPHPLRNSPTPPTPWQLLLEQGAGVLLRLLLWPLLQCCQWHMVGYRFNEATGEYEALPGDAGHGGASGNGGGVGGKEGGEEEAAVGKAGAGSAAKGADGDAVGGDAVGGDAVGGDAVGGDTVGGDTVGGDAAATKTEGGALAGEGRADEGGADTVRTTTTVAAAAGDG